MPQSELARPLAAVPATEADYQRVPWLRKSGTNTVFIVLHILTLGMLPFLLITCIMLVTGDIYYNRVGADGRLERWSTANKIIAWILLLPPLIFLAILVFAVIAQIAGF